ncbi:MAG: tRNA (adenosine(37)-N6)-threonylcarbamoyltransferase complex dimerization subunit type 1 TsaB [Firmicutes bacterium]|nr:tRNA (adenosine(37)-N6)-threonylcarbamoyltransferase complex dimerization subunit type 1 TsaB [Bacillota bacterium]
MRILGIDTAITTGGAALIEGEQITAEYILNIRATHSERLLPALDRLFKDTGLDGSRLDGIAVALGPGSFTGLRIGTATAKALAYTWDKPLIGVNVLEGLAYQVETFVPWVCSLVDARHDEVYGSLYQVGDGSDVPKAVICPQAAPVRQFVEQVLEISGVEKICFTGDGAAAYKGLIGDLTKERLVFPGNNNIYLRPSSIAFLGLRHLQAGRQDDPMSLAPMYLRLPEAQRRLEARNRQSS